MNAATNVTEPLKVKSIITILSIPPTIKVFEGESEVATAVNLEQATRIAAAVNANNALIETLEILFISLGKLGANGDLDSPVRKEWELARDTLALAKQEVIVETIFNR